MNLLNSCGAAAWQTVFHFHVHVIPRYRDDPLRLPWVPGPGRRRRDRRRRRGAARLMARAGRASSATARSRSSPSTRPPLNLFDAAMIAALQAAVADVAADPPRGLLVRAEGRVVSGGVDVHLFDGLEPAGGGRGCGPSCWR